MRRIHFTGGRLDRAPTLGPRPGNRPLLAGAAPPDTPGTTTTKAQQRDAAARTCMNAAATPAAQAIFSYDYRTFDASVAKARTFITGDFVGEYAKTTPALKPTAVQVQGRSFRLRYRPWESSR